jgi:hypothetical protein
VLVGNKGVLTLTKLELQVRLPANLPITERLPRGLPRAGFVLFVLVCTAKKPTHPTEPNQTQPPPLHPQGSKSQNLTSWPSNIPLLLSAFKAVESGVIRLTNVLVRVANAGALAAGLNQLPAGALSAPEVPDLRPLYGRPPAPGATNFTIQSWQLDSKRWAQWTHADTLPSAVAQWVFQVCLAARVHRRFPLWVYCPWWVYWPKTTGNATTSTSTSTITNQPSTERAGCPV